MQYFNIKNRIFVYCTLALFICPFFAIASESYLAFSSNAYIKLNSEVTINEEFIYDFEKNSKHGLYRNIPLVYEEYEEWFGIHSIDVKNKENKPYTFEVNDPGNIVKIKIGDPKITLNGSHYYNLNYTLVNIAKENSFKWKVIDNIREPISKLQAQIFFPIPIGINSATSSCLLISNENSRFCNMEPIIKSDLIIGYKVYIENISNEDVVLSVNYPSGMITVAKIDNNNHTKYIKIFVIFISIAFIISLAYFTYIKRKNISILIKKLRMIKVPPDQYSYLTRAVSYNGYINNDDIVATLIDLSDRGYILIEEKISELNTGTFVDYTIKIVSEDLPEGAEGYLINLINDEVDSLRDWLNNITDEDKLNICNLSKEEIVNVKIIKSDEELPKLDKFVI